MSISSLFWNLLPLRRERERHRVTAPSGPSRQQKFCLQEPRRVEQEGWEFWLHGSSPQGTLLPPTQSTGPRLQNTWFTSGHCFSSWRTRAHCLTQQPLLGEWNMKPISAPSLLKTAKHKAVRWRWMDLSQTVNSGTVCRVVTLPQQNLQLLRENGGTFSDECTLYVIKTSIILPPLPSKQKMEKAEHLADPFQMCFQNWLLQKQHWKVTSKPATQTTPSSRYFST